MVWRNANYWAFDSGFGVSHAWPQSATNVLQNRGETLGRETHPTFDAIHDFSKVRDRQELYGTRNPARGVSIRTSREILLK